MACHIGFKRAVAGLRPDDPITETSVRNICAVLGIRPTRGLIRALERMNTHEEIVAWFLKILAKQSFNDALLGFTKAIEMCICTNERLAVYMAFLLDILPEKRWSFDKFAYTYPKVETDLASYYMLSETKKEEYFRGVLAMSEIPPKPTAELTRHLVMARTETQMHKVTQAVNLATDYDEPNPEVHGSRPEWLDRYGQSLDTSFFGEEGICSRFGCQRSCMTGSDLCDDCSPSELRKRVRGEHLTMGFLKAISMPEPGCCQAVGCGDKQSIEWGSCCSRICHNSSQRLKIPPKEELLVKLNELRPENLCQAIFQMMWISYPATK